MSADVLAAALRHAARGRPVFPVEPTTKAPALPGRGLLDATTDAAAIRAWPWPGLGLVTGQRSGLVVLDIDPRSRGDEGIAAATGRLGQLPRTRRVATPGGGFHLYLRAPPVPIPCSAGRLAPGVDVRAAGGYVVAPPTRGPRGAWRVVIPAPPAELPPRWLAALRVPADGDRRRPAVAPDEWAALVRGPIREGGRRAALARLAGRLLRCGVASPLVLELLLAVNVARCRPPLADGDELRDLGRLVADLAGREAGK
jgi:Bifunctional DNA primase/polymerase, N-terminal